MSTAPTSRFNPTLREVNANAPLNNGNLMTGKPQVQQLSKQQIQQQSNTTQLQSQSLDSPSESGFVSPTESDPSQQQPTSQSQHHRELPSPGADRNNRHLPYHCSEMVHDIVEMFYRREQHHPRDPNYMANQPEVNEKMRTILIDWLVDVCLKFKLHQETFFLCVDLVDRYLAIARVSRSQLQLVGVTCMLLAAKYEEIWPPEMSECVHVAANTYTADEILRMERQIAGALCFKFTTPTPFPLLLRLLEVTNADSVTRHTAFFFLEHAVLSYRNLHFLPSELAHASLYLAHVTLQHPDPWNYTCQYYSRGTKVEDIRPCAQTILEFAALITNSKYQAIRRKYSNYKYSEVSRLAFPTELPV